MKYRSVFIIFLLFLVFCFKFSNTFASEKITDDETIETSSLSNNNNIMREDQLLEYQLGLLLSETINEAQNETQLVNNNNVMIGNQQLEEYRLDSLPYDLKGEIYQHYINRCLHAIEKVENDAKRVMALIAFGDISSENRRIAEEIWRSKWQKKTFNLSSDLSKYEIKKISNSIFLDITIDDILIDNSKMYVLLCNSCIKYLTLSDMNFDITNFKGFIQGFPKNNSLEKLVFVHCIFNNNANTLANQLASHTRIKYLQLSHCELTDDFIRALCVPTLSLGLENFTLDHNNIGNEGAILLANLTSLKVLHLGNNKIANEGAIALVYLFAHTNLKALYLNNNQVGDVGAQSLAQILAGNNTITELGLENNPIQSIEQINNLAGNNVNKLRLN